MKRWKMGVGEFGIPRFQFEIADVATKLRNLWKLLDAASITANKTDDVQWTTNEGGLFTVKGCFQVFSKQHTPYGPFNNFDAALKEIWRMDVPIKVKAFDWKCFINKLPAHDALSSNGIINPSLTSCVYSREKEETYSHLLLKCYNSGLVWKDIAEWIGIGIYKADDIKESFLLWIYFCKKQKMRKGKEGVVWLAVVWSLWKIRNDIIFRGDTCNISYIVWEIKALVWRWTFIGKITQPNCIFTSLVETRIFNYHNSN